MCRKMKFVRQNLTSVKFNNLLDQQHFVPCSTCKLDLLKNVSVDYHSYLTISHMIRSTNSRATLRISTRSVNRRFQNQNWHRIWRRLMFKVDSPALCTIQINEYHDLAFSLQTMWIRKIWSIFFISSTFAHYLEIVERLASGESIKKEVDYSNHTNFISQTT